MDPMMVWPKSRTRIPWSGAGDGVTRPSGGSRRARPARKAALGRRWPTIVSARRPASISASRSMPVSMPISLAAAASSDSSEAMLPGAPGCAANGQAAQAADRGIELGDAEPQPLIGVGYAEPARVVQVQGDFQLGPALAHGADDARHASWRRPAHGIGRAHRLVGKAVVAGDGEAVLDRAGHTG